MKENRLYKMEEYVKEHKSVSLDELCSVFNVSKNTIRRDVGILVERTDLKKTYGGVTAPYNRIPPAFSDRLAVNLDVKRKIGEEAAKLVNDGDIIYIDSGTTTCQMIDFLKDRKDVVILTHSLDVINRALAYPNLTLISLSGQLNHTTYSFTGQTTIDVLRNYNISKAFMAANGITLKNGATQSTSIEFAIKKEVVSRSNEVYVMIESHKFGNADLLTYCPIDHINAIITEKKPNKDVCSGLSKLGCNVITF